MKVLMRAVTAAGLASFAVVGLAATTSSATAVKIPIDQTNPFFVPIGSPPPAGKGFSYVNCTSVVLSAMAALEFVDGNGHLYGPTTHPLTNGGNIEGNAYLLGFDQNTGALLYSYYGQGHFWVGQNNSPLPPGTPNAPTPGPNAQVQAQTVMFHGTGVGDTTGSIDVQGSFGQTQSASGHQSGWAHLKITC